MSDILELYESQPELMLYALAVVVVSLSLLIWLIHYLIKTSTSRKIKSAVTSVGGQAVENISLSDGVDSVVQIDFCIYSHGHIFVLNIQDYPGIIFGGEKVEQWTQLFKGKSYKFTNPLYYNQLCVQAVREMLPGIPVVGQVVFTHHGEFPKGKPDSVSRLEDLAKDLLAGKEKTKSTSAQDIVWQDFVEEISQNKQTRIYKMQPVA